MSKNTGLRFAILPCGTIENDMALDYNMYRSGTAGDRTPCATWWTKPVFAVLFYHPETGYFLYDGGVAPQYAYGAGGRCAETERYMPYYPATDGGVERGLARLGVRLDEVGKIVLSGFHFDKTGVLHRLSGYPAEREVWVPKADFAEGLIRTHKGDGDLGLFYSRMDFELSGITYRYVGEDEDGLELAPGVRLLVLGGCFPATLALLVDMEGGGYLFPGPAMPTAGNLTPAALSPSLCYDTMAFGKTAMRLSRLAEGRTVIFSRDPESFCKLKATPDWYGV